MNKKMIYKLAVIANLALYSVIFATFDPRLTRDIVIDIDTTLTTCCAQIEVNFEGTFTTLDSISSLLQLERCVSQLIRQSDVGTTGFTITSSGAYKFTENIVFSPIGSAAAITINADNVLLDLQCFSITQGNATAQVDGIAIGTNQTNVLVINGQLKNFTRDGIRVASGATNLAYADMTIQNCLYGIFCLGTGVSPIEIMSIKGLDFISNSTGISLTFVNRAAIIESVFFDHAHAGIELITSFSNSIDSCSIEKTGASTGSAFGISMISGGDNRVQNCYIDGVSTTDTFSGNSAVGILIGATENNDVIIKNQISNCTTTSNAQPFGIEMQYTLPALSIQAGSLSLIPDIVVWSPNGRYVLSNNTGSSVVDVLENKSNPFFVASELSVSGNVAWSPDGQYVAISGRIYRVNQGILTLVTSVAGTGQVAWSPDGIYLALIAGGIQIYKFNGTSLILVTSTTLLSAGTTFSLQWSPDSQYLAASSSTGFFVYQWSNNLLQQVATLASTTTRSGSWSNNGQFILISDLVNGISVYQFSGSSLNLRANAAVTLPTVVNAAWSPDGNYVVSAVVSIGGDSNILQAYKFSGFALFPLSNVTTTFAGSKAPLAWSPVGTEILNTDGGILLTEYSGLQFPSGTVIYNNKISSINGPALSAGQPGVSSGRGISASSANNLIFQNTVFDADLAYVFVNNTFEQFIANAAQRPSLLSNIFFPPL